MNQGIHLYIIHFISFFVLCSCATTEQHPRKKGNCSVVNNSSSLRGEQRVQSDLERYDRCLNEMTESFKKQSSEITNIEKIKKQLQFMVDKDQFMRSFFSLPHTSGYNEKETKLFNKAFLNRFKELDRENTQSLKKILEREKWIRISKFGKKADHNAWLIVQHADLDPEFQKEVLKTLDKMRKENETNSQNFAYLFDRVASLQGKSDKRGLQRFGTQGRCVGPGLWKAFPVESPQKLDQLRESLGLEPMTVYKKRFKDICH